MRPQLRTISALDNDADGICESQTPVGAGALDIDGVLAVDGTVTLDVAQRVTVTSVGDETGVVFTVTGKDENSKDITEDITGANAGAASGSLFFKEITEVSADGATADAVTVGVLAANGGVSNSIMCNWRASDFKVGMSVTITGTLNATVQQTLDNLYDPDITSPYWSNTTGLTAITANDVGNLDFPVIGVRLKLNSWTSGSATLNYVQQG